MFTLNPRLMFIEDPAPAAGAGAPAGDPPADPPADDPVPGEEALGDPGKKALDIMKAAKKTAEQDAREAREALAALQAKLDGKEAEHAAEQERRKVEDAALAKANERILKAEVRAVAATKLADPADALLHLDLSGFEVGADGEVDTEAVRAAIDDLVARKPYLAAQGGARFKGSADGGTRTESAKSIDDEIAAATAAGDHRGAIRLKRQKAYADKP